MSNISPPSSFVSLKYEVAPVHVMKAYARCTGIAILILNLCNGWRWVVVRSRLLYPQQITPIPIEYKARWAQSQLKSLVPAGNRTPDRPARNLVTIPTTSSQPSFWHSWQFILRTRQTIRHCVTCEVYEIPLSTAGIMVTGRTSFVYAPVQLSRWLNAVVTTRKFNTTVTRCYTAAQAVGPASEPKSVHVVYVVETEALRRFVRVVGVFPVRAISPVLHTHPFRLSPMLFGFGVKRHEINTLEVTWPLIGFSSPVSYYYRICIVVSSCAHFYSFSDMVSISSPSSTVCNSSSFYRPQQC